MLGSGWLGGLALVVTLCSCGGSSSGESTGPTSCEPSRVLRPVPFRQCLARAGSELADLQEEGLVVWEETHAQSNAEELGARGEECVGYFEVLAIRGFFQDVTRVAEAAGMEIAPRNGPVAPLEATRGPAHLRAECAWPCVCRLVISFADPVSPRELAQFVHGARALPELFGIATTAGLEPVSVHLQHMASRSPLRVTTLRIPEGADGSPLLEWLRAHHFEESSTRRDGAGVSIWELRQGARYSRVEIDRRRAVLRDGVGHGLNILFTGSRAVDSFGRRPDECGRACWGALAPH